jgi:AcrR family transcriptional regulator
MMRAVAKKKRFHHGDLRRALLQAVVELYAKDGPGGVTMRTVAARTGVTHAAPYRHFASKQEMLAAVAQEGFTILRDEIAAAVATRSDPLDRWEEIGVSYVKFAVRHPCHFRIMYSAELAGREAFPILRDASSAAFRGLRDVVIASQEAGRVRAGDAVELALTAWAMMHGLAVLLLERQFTDVGRDLDQAEALARAASRTLREGLQPKA